MIVITTLKIQIILAKYFLVLEIIFQFSFQIRLKLGKYDMSALDKAKLQFFDVITLLRLEIAVAAAKLYAPQIFKDEHNPSIKPIKKKSRNFSLHILQHSYSRQFTVQCLNLPNQFKYLLLCISLNTTYKSIQNLFQLTQFTLIGGYYTNQLSYL